MLMLARIIIATFLLFTNLKTKAQSVYVSSNEKEYHSKSCTLTKTKKIEITLLQANKNGFLPCKNCQTKKNKSKKISESSGEIYHSSEIRTIPKNYKQADIANESGSIIWVPTKKPKK